MADSTTIHASAILVGAHALLIRGPSGSGKSRLAFTLTQSAAGDPSRLVRLIADDRVIVDAMHGRLIVSAPEKLRGLIELRGLGIQKLPFEPRAAADCVVDLAAPDAMRLPLDEARETVIAGIRLARLAVAPGADPLPAVRAFLHTGRG